MFRAVEQLAPPVSHAGAHSTDADTSDPAQVTDRRVAESESSMSGSLASVGSLRVMQFLADLSQSGRLSLSRGGWTAEVVFDDGWVVEAIAGRERGLAALEFIVLTFVDGNFVFSRHAPFLTGSNGAQGMAPWAHLDKVLAAHAEGIGALPQPTTIPSLVEPATSSEGQELAVDRDALAVLLEVDGQRSIGQIADTIGGTRSLRALAQLAELNLITYDMPPAATVPPVRTHSPYRPYLKPVPGGPYLAPEPTVSATPSLEEVPVSPPARRANPIRSWRHMVIAPRVKSLAQELCLFLVLTGLLMVGLRAVVQSFRVEGSSMDPTFATGEFLLINRAAYVRVEGSPLDRLVPAVAQGSMGYLFGGPRRGDVAVFAAPPQPGQDFVKRIIGLPGDTVLIKKGSLFVNGQLISEPYVRFASSYTYPSDSQPLVVPDGNYFVLGDNRPVSLDSHLGWFVPADNLVGRVWFSFWPPSKWGAVSQMDLLPGTPADDQTQTDLLPGTPTDDQTPLVTGVPSDSDVDAPTTDFVPGGGSAAPSTEVVGPILDEQFSIPQPGWPNNPAGTAWFDVSGYRLFAREPRQFVALRSPISAAPQDVAVSASFHKVGGPPGGGYGLILRDQEPYLHDGVNQRGHYLVAEVGDRGEVGIWRRDDSQWIDLLPWTPSSVVRTGGAANDLSFEANGDQLTLVVNGSEVAHVADGTLSGGGVGVFVGGDLNQVALDRLVVQAESPVARAIPPAAALAHN
jgi:signal peptidase I